MRKGIIFLIGFTSLKFVASACGWDWDTIQMEKQQFPTIHELITGKFLRHSQEFYYWRVRDRKEKIAIYPDSLELYDDLAWAYDKTGNHEKAIELMLRKEELSPGVYETYANLGTSYIHNGQLKKGLEYIRKAININPDAHFGREIYQQYVVEYVLEKQINGELKLPLSVGNEPDFYTFLKTRHFKEAIQNGSTRSEEIAKAIKGIAGMMKFGQHTSPVLLEVLGDLLYAANSGTDPGAGHLAARAYLKASFGINDPEISRIYEQKADQSIERVYVAENRGNRPHDMEHKVYPLKNLIAVLKIEMLSADNWFQDIRNNEIYWIRNGIDPDSAFAANYYDEPSQEYIYESNSAVADNVDEEAWLAYQLQRPEHIRSIHQIEHLDAKTIATLDSIYDAEFASVADTSRKNNNGSQNATDGNEENSEDNLSDSMLMYVLLGIVVILVFVFAILKNRSPGKR